MKFEKSKFCAMLANYAETEIVPKITSGNSGLISDSTAKVIALTAVSLFKRSDSIQNKIFKKYPIIDCLFDEDGMIDPDELIDALSDSLDRFGDFEITILNQKFKFKASDIKTLKKYMNWSEAKDV